MKTNVVSFLLVFLALSTILSAATIYVDSAGSDTSPYETCAKGAALLSTAITAWTTSDVIFVEDNHSEAVGTSVTYSNANDSFAVPIPIYSVDCTDDSYSPAASVQIDQTGGGTDDMTFDGHFKIHGLNFNINDDLLITASDASFFLVDGVLTFDVNTASQITMGTGGTVVTMSNSTIDFSNASGGGIFFEEKDVVFHGVNFDGNPRAGGLLLTSIRGGVFRCVGCDFLDYGSGTLVDASNASTGFFNIYFTASKLPSIINFHDSGFETDGQFIFVSGTDADGASDGESFRQELYTFRGDVSTDEATYRDDGLVFTEGTTNASLKLTPASNVSVAEPLCSWPTHEWINTTGSKTFTTEVRENYTTAVNDEQFWQEVYYLGTTNSAMWTLDIGQDVLAGSSLTTSSETWTETMTGDRGAKVATTVTVNSIGLYAVRWCLAVFESGKEFYVDADPTVS